MQFKILIQTIRPSFLLLTPVCVFLGFSTTFNPTTIDFSLLLWVLLGAMSAHISVNALNEYYDYKSGLDLLTQKTPFSGGSGVLPENPNLAYPVLIIGLIGLVIMVTIGAYLTFIKGSGVLLIGITGLCLIITYTQWINRYPIMCLLAPGFGFGILMVLGTHLALVENASGLFSAILVALVPFCLVNNLLLLNQYPDIEADKQVGRNTFPIAFGIEKSNKVYAVFFGVAHFLILLYVITGILPLISLIALLPIPLGVFVLMGMRKYFEKIVEHPQVMAANVALTLLTPLLLGISLFVRPS